MDTEGATGGRVACEPRIQSEDGAVSMLVDDVGDVIDIPLNRYAPVPENMPLEQRELIEGVYHLDDGLLLVLDTTQLLQNACN